MYDVTIFIPTFNEEQHIERCLEGVKAFKNCRVIVVDSGSSDRTVSIVKDNDAELITCDARILAEKVNFVDSLLKNQTKWIFRIDADELPTDELVDFVNNQLPKLDKVSAVSIRRRYYFLGRWMKHGGLHPSWQTRIWKPGTATMEHRELDEHLEVRGEVMNVACDVSDKNLNSIYVWLFKHVGYAERESKQLVEGTTNNDYDSLEGQQKVKRVLKYGFYYKAPLFLRCLLYWLYRYFLKLGFLDGKEGFIYHFLHAFVYRSMVDAILYEKNKIQNTSDID